MDAAKWEEASARRRFSGLGGQRAQAFGPKGWWRHRVSDGPASQGLPLPTKPTSLGCLPLGPDKVRRGGSNQGSVSGLCLYPPLNSILMEQHSLSTTLCLERRKGQVGQTGQTGPAFPGLTVQWGDRERAAGPRRCGSGGLSPAQQKEHHHPPPWPGGRRHFLGTVISGGRAGSGSKDPKLRKEGDYRAQGEGGEGVGRRPELGGHHWRPPPPPPATPLAGGAGNQLACHKGGLVTETWALLVPPPNMRRSGTHSVP